VIWPFSRNKKQDAINALAEQLFYRLDEQDKQLYRMERAQEDQKKQIEKMMRRVDQATNRGVA